MARPKPSGWLANLALRVGSALVLVPVVVVALAWPRPYLAQAVVWIAAVVGLRELYAMTLSDRVERAMAVTLGALATAGFILLPPGEGIELVFSGVVVAAFAFLLFRFGDMRTVAARGTAVVAGVAYVGLGLAFIVQLKLLDARGGLQGGRWVAVLLSVAWFGDTAAYFAGRFFGRHKLYPAVSPGKTVEGGIGGLIGSVLATTLAKLWYFPAFSWADVFLIAIPAGVVGQIGDLVESLLKRGSGVKDSGHVFPGHGGMLDRVDAVLFAAPVVYAYARYVFHG